MRQLLTHGIAIFAIAFLAFELSINGVWTTDHATSFVQLDYALWNSHSVALGNLSSVPPLTVDDFHFGGHNYSALAPGTAFLALPFMGVAFTIAGGYTTFGPALVMSETFVSLTGAISAYLVYRIAGLFFRRSTSVFLGFAFAFSTICWPFATFFFQSDVSAMLVLLAAYFALKVGRTEGESLAPTLLCGLAAGAAFTVDYVNAVLLPILLVFLVVMKRGSWSSTAWTAAAFVLGALPGLITIGAYDFAIFGSPFVTTEQTYLRQSSLLGSFSTPLPIGLALDLVSLSKGLFVFTPFLVLGAMGYTDGLRAKEGKEHRPEMIMLLAIFLGILLPYSAWYDPSGGVGFGPRFLVAAIPFLLLPAGYAIEQAKGVLTWITYGTYLVGVAINGMAALASPIPPVSPFNVSPFFRYVLPNFEAGRFDTFWRSSAYAWVAGAALIIVLGAVLPISLVEKARRRENSQRENILVS
jgi:hypothetical protein